MRSKPFRRRPGAPRKKAIWVNIPFGAVAFTETAGTQILLVGEDWEAQFTGLANEHAVLRTVVGDLCLKQTTVGTEGGNFFWGLYIQDNNATVPPSFTTTGMSEVDWLHVGARPTSSSVTASINTTLENGTEHVAIKTRRRISSRDSVFLVCQFASDAASPAGIASGVLRFLVARD